MPAEDRARRALEAAGGVVAIEALTAPRALALARLLGGRDDLGVRLVEARESGEFDSLVIDVQVDVGQRPVVPIAKVERLLIRFPRDDGRWPSATSLRPDFPRRISHVFLAPADELVTLCLSEVAWVEARTRWTAGRFLRLLRTWLIDTARGKLHRDDQPLEPFLLGFAHRAIVPPDVLDRAMDEKAVLAAADGGGGDSDVLRFGWVGPEVEGSIGFVAAVFELPPRLHGVIECLPRTLGELVQLVSTPEHDFMSPLKETVGAWLGRPGFLDKRPVLFLRLPMRRERDGPPERIDLWAFYCDGTIGDLGVALGLWARAGGVGAAVLTFVGPDTPPALHMALQPLNPVFDLTPEAAAAFQGYTRPTDRTIFAVGAGALGSQVLLNLARAGETIVGVADNDLLLPHNLARHAATDRFLCGQSKARVTAMMIADLMPRTEAPTAFMVDAAGPGPTVAQPFADALSRADVILDLAASVSVSRHLALDQASVARRVSVFLNPAGDHLVVLAEDAGRDLRLDEIEQGYYAAVLADDRLAGHFSLPEGRRYARSCREISARLPQSAVGMWSALAAEAVRVALGSPDAFASVWRLAPETLTTDRIDIALAGFQRFQAGDWSVSLSNALMRTVADARAARLPNETGGVLLGEIDMSRRAIYLTAALPSPPDSRETPTGYVRGAFGLRSAIERVARRSLDTLTYAGEWHSHPRGAGVQPSREDLVLYDHLCAHMEVEGYPPIMLIVGDHGFNLVVDGQFQAVA